jgi:hypothetical protein
MAVMAMRDAPTLLGREETLTRCVEGLAGGGGILLTTLSGMSARAVRLSLVGDSGRVVIVVNAECERSARRDLV